MDSLVLFAVETSSEPSGERSMAPRTAPKTHGVRFPPGSRFVIAVGAACLIAAALLSGCRGNSPERGWTMLGYGSRGTNFYPIASEAVGQGWKLREDTGLSVGHINYPSFEIVAVRDGEDRAVPVSIHGAEWSGCEIWVGDREVLSGDGLTLVGQVNADGGPQVELVLKNTYHELVRSSSPDSLLAIRNVIIAGFTDTLMAMCGPGDSLVVRSELCFADLDGTVVKRIPCRAGVNRICQVGGGILGRRAALVTDQSSWQASDLLYQRYFREVYSAGHGPMYRALSYSFAEGIATERGVAAIDLDSGEELWFYATASFPYMYAVHDVCGDEQPEILLGSYSPHNLINASNMTDLGHAHVILLDAYGAPLWVYTLPGIHIGARTGIARLGTGAEYGVVVAAGNAAAEWGMLAVLEPSGGEVIALTVSEFSYTSLVIADLDGDEADEIVTGTTDGRFLVLNGDLDVVAEASPTPPDELFRRVSCFAQCANDIDGDGSIELVGAWAKLRFEEPTRERLIAGPADTASLCVGVLSRDLELLDSFWIEPERGAPAFAWHQPPAYFARVCDVDGDRVNDIVTSYGGRLRVLSPTPPRDMAKASAGEVSAD